MDVEILSKYAVLIRNTKVRLHRRPDILMEDDGEKNNDEITINAGALIKIFQSKTPSPSGLSSSGFKNLSTIQVLDLVNEMPIYENLYECPQASLRSVAENLWPYIIPIVDPEQRLRMLQDTSHCKWLVYLKINDLVSVSGEMFNKPATNFYCIIRYIGPIEELHSVGYFFGLEILDLESGLSPQLDKVTLTNSYMQCDPSLSIFTTANWISQIPKEQQRKFSPRDLINGTIEKFKSAIGPSSSLTGSVASNTSSLKRDKKTKKNKVPSAQFYDKIEHASDIYTNNKMERSKMDPSNPMTLNSDEFKQSIENREKSLERRATTNTVQTQTQPQSGILKNKHKEQTKSTTILPANGPEIVVINTTDIEKESQDVDLAEILGSDWPKTAGDAAVILNKQKLQNNSSGSAGGSTTGNNIGTTYKSNRNRSSNPLTHLAGNNAKKTIDSTSPNNKNNDNNKIQR